MPLFGPWLESSIHLAGVVHLRLFFWWLDLQLLAWHLSSSSSTSGEGGLHRHQVPTMVVAAHHKQIPILCLAGVDGRAPVATILLLTTALSQQRLCQLRKSWHGGKFGDCSKVNSHNIRGRRSSSSPVLPFGSGFSLQLHNVPLYSTVNAHAALVGG